MVLVLGYDGAELLDIACVTTTLTTGVTTAAMINGRPAGETPYEVRLLTPGGRPITCSSGLQLQAHGALERHRGPADTLVVSGGFGSGAVATDQRVVGHVRRVASLVRRVASVCTGAVVLAATGLLDGRRATTHWGFASMIADHYPAVEFDPGPIYIRDGHVYTSAGVTAALDLTLALIAEDLGEARAREVARALVTYLHRPGNQAQISLHVGAPAPSDPIVSKIVEHITQRLGGDLTTSTLASRAGISTRHLCRLFQADLGQTPAHYVRRARAEAAAQLLSTTSLPLTRIAKRCGFATTEGLRTAFNTIYGIPPSQFRLINTDAAPPQVRRSASWSPSAVRS
ncbi:GlxA family transcriptional regulator [Kribbella shirazensis]|uniref:Transcriptional regulator GlxA family with amidase domain n=1 Tax=Kribbella shirazensis TaxID=1105143 RepID=A0A7X5VJM6_9ACTN|nr:helix-turn-helix domain-containing protein [Kribbella shirazensis]NIK62500.1 transcriptional regulator GlxA family with amidase domain [Kribbella shirazensis]